MTLGRMRVLGMPLFVFAVLLLTSGCRSCHPRGACPTEVRGTCCGVPEDRQCDRGTFGLFLLDGAVETPVGYMWSSGSGTSAHHEVWAFFPGYTPPRCYPTANDLELRIRCHSSQPSINSCQAFATWAQSQGCSTILHHVIAVGVP